MGEQEQVKTFGDWATIAIAKHYKKILKHEPKVLQDKDPEELHQMRVGMRRLRSTITGFAPALDLPEEVGEKQIGKIAKILGKLRDLDVLLDTLKTGYASVLPSKEQKILDKAIQVLGKKRTKVFKQVKSTLKNQNYQHFQQKIDNWLKNPQYKQIAALEIREVLPDLLSPQISRFLLHPGWLVGVNIEAGKVKLSDRPAPEIVEQILIDRGEDLHDLRKEAKRSRYNMELFTDFYCDTYAHYLKQIKELQSVLGEIQDSFVLREVLEQVLQANIADKMPTLDSKLQVNRYQKWQEWEMLQQQFLDPKNRKDLRLTVQYPQ
ncbi:MAG: CHAD domain-containing protein [Xenococcaceae cyanobacterium MO_188.B32]|nr:CHAD domain-containing protein [Xenococcaceae cyanobacterium MO_188.B32]